MFKLREIEIEEILRVSDIYDIVAFQRINKQWRFLIRTKILPQYLEKNWDADELEFRNESNERKSAILVDLLQTEEKIMDGDFCFSVKFFESIHQITTQSYYGDWDDVDASIRVTRWNS